MCPACYATTAWIIAGATSTGGVTALVATNLYISKKQASKAASQDASQLEQDADLSSIRATDPREE